MVETPPPMRTSAPFAAARAWDSASWMPSVTKWKTVPPSIVIGSRGWWLSTKMGTWYGGSSPHQPFHASSGQGPRIGPNMFRPRIQAPMLRNPRAANSSSMPVLPPTVANTFDWKVAVANAQVCSASPPTPSGWTRFWSGPAP